MINKVGVRKAALALASMHPADRRWMLAHMPPAWRPPLSALISEAQTHVSIDPELLQTALADEHEQFEHDLPTPDILIVLLDRLASHWVARVLVAVVPDHAEIYLATCDKNRGEAIRREMMRLPNPFPASLAHAMACYLGEAGHAVRSSGAAP